MNGQLDMTGTMLTVVPSSGDVFEMPAGEGWCDRCGVMAEWISDTAQGGDTWGLSCCYFQCEHCTDLHYRDEQNQCGACDNCCDHTACSYCCVCCDWDCYCAHCEQCESCCSCEHCSYCGHAVEVTCGDCSYCSDCCSCYAEDECSCSDCQSGATRYGRGIVPGWEDRGDAVPSAETLADLLPMSEHTAPAAPVPMMADFYLAEWCAVISSDVRVRRAARTLQSAIVAACDSAFREYVFAAIGGELRHHARVDLGGGRETAWRYWRGLSETSGRVQLIRDAVALFGDGSWSAGYGGRAWQICAEVLLARETGALDPRTFVDRVFSLQHNGGSLLNKTSWRGGDVYYCRDIGNAHAADVTAVGTLLNWASADGRSLLRDVNLSDPRVTDWQRADISYAMRDEVYGADWTADTWIHRNRPSTSTDTYGAALEEQQRCYAAADYVADMVRSGAAWWQRYADESAWQYNARLCSYWEQRI